MENDVLMLELLREVKEDITEVKASQKELREEVNSRLKDKKSDTRWILGVMAPIIMVLCAWVFNSIQKASEERAEMKRDIGVIDGELRVLYPKEKFGETHDKYLSISPKENQNNIGIRR